MTLVRTHSWFANSCIIISLHGRKQEESQLSVSSYKSTNPIYGALHCSDLIPPKGPNS